MASNKSQRWCTNCKLYYKKNHYYQYYSHGYCQKRKRRWKSQVTRIKLIRSENLPLERKIQNDQDEPQDFEDSTFEKYREEDKEESSSSYREEAIEQIGEGKDLNLAYFAGDEQEPCQGLGQLANKFSTYFLNI